MIHNALASPLIYNRHLIEKSEETKQSGLKILAGAMLCVAGVTLLAAAVYLTLQTVGVSLPVTLPLGALALGLVSAGLGMMSAPAFGLGVRFFRQASASQTLAKCIHTFYEASEDHQAARYARH